MPKGVTQTRRFFVSKEELRQLVEAGREYTFPRVTVKYIREFQMKNEDLRNISPQDLVLLEVA